ncbi:MAG: aldo/keto reductase [Myxococcota bacterium]
MTAIPHTARLRDGHTIPRVGLGVYQTPRGDATRLAVKSALELGYRHIDTAKIYGNEADVGAAVRDSGLPRSEVFVTTKLFNRDQGYDRARKAFDASLTNLGLAYVDLYLIHWPVQNLRLESWRALEAIHADGRARSIGVSNFLVPHLEELLGSCRTPPAVDQIELSPFLQRRDTTALCAANGIVVEAYSPLTRGQKLDHPVLVEVAREVGRTVPQVLLRWGLQHDAVVLPKSVRPERQRENLDLFGFELTPSQLATLDALETGQATGWDPSNQA